MFTEFRKFSKTDFGFTVGRLDFVKCFWSFIRFFCSLFFWTAMLFFTWDTFLGFEKLLPLEIDWYLLWEELETCLLKVGVSFKILYESLFFFFLVLSDGTWSLFVFTRSVLFTGFLLFNISLEDGWNILFIWDLLTLLLFTLTIFLQFKHFSSWEREIHNLFTNLFISELKDPT